MPPHNDPFPAPEVPPYFRTQPEILDDRSGFAIRTPTAKENITDDTVPFRPVVRLPVAVLVVLDDGRSDGQTIRLRTESFTIGRAEGDLVLPHDGMISRKHATIYRRSEKGRVRWVLEDHKSQNGTFVRVSDAVLTHDQMVLLGSRRYQFNAAPRAVAATTADTSADSRTQGWQAISATDLIPSLTEVRPDGTKGEPVFLSDNEIIIGRAADCGMVLNDLMASPHHAKLHKDDRGNWVIENLSALNGTWVRVDSVVFERSGQFLIGEQRFTLRV